MPPERADRGSTTFPSCDRFLDEAELSGRCSTLEPRPLARMIESLDLQRRTYRRMATKMDREATVEACDLAARQMAESIEDTCGGQR
jgi:hypothetical protein